MDERDSKMLFEMQAELCRVLGHAVRLQIINLLTTRPMPNSELLELLDIPKANLSQHLGVLEKAGIIKVERVGISAEISLAMPEVKKACSSVRQVLQEQLSQQLASKKKMKRVLENQKARAKP